MTCDLKTERGITKSVCFGCRDDHIYTLFSPRSFSETLSSFALTWKVRIILHYSRRCTNFFKKIYTRISRFLKPVVHNNERAHNSQMCNERLRFTCVGELKLVISQWGITKRWSELKKRINNAFESWFVYRRVFWHVPIVHHQQNRLRLPWWLQWYVRENYSGNCT